MLKVPKPSRSAVQCGLAAIATVLLLSWVRPLGVLFLGLVSYWLYWTRCSFRIVFTQELQQKFELWLQRASDWRRTSPTMFCVVSSGCLGTLAILGHLISGSTLVLTLLVLSALISTKYNFKLLKIEHKDFQWSEKLNYNTAEADADADAEDEFMPDWNESNLFVLERASDVATLSLPTEANEGEDEGEHSDADVPSELLIPDAIPEIDEHSTDEEVAVNELATQKQAKSSSAPAMEFRKGHFKRDSSLSTTSSSSEESLSKGLQFPDHTTVDGGAGVGAALLRQLTDSEAPAESGTTDLVALAVKTQTQALLASKLLPNLMSNLVQWGAGGGGAAEATQAEVVKASNSQQSQQQQQQQESQPSHLPRRIVTALDSSDESDFEILEKDDFK